MRWTPETLHEIHALLPYTAQALIGCIGVEATGRLLDALPGVALHVPKHPDRHPSGARSWALLTEIIGEPAMRQLAARWGGDVLDIPTCHAARTELHARQVRALFDRLTRAEGYSGNQAVTAICIAHAPISSRAVEKICGRGDAEAAAVQGSLF